MKSNKMPELSVGLRRKFHDGVVWAHLGLKANRDTAAGPQGTCLAPGMQLVTASVPVRVPTGLWHAGGEAVLPLVCLSSTARLLHLKVLSILGEWTVQHEASSLLPSGQLWGSCWDIRACTEGAHPRPLSIRMLLVAGCEEKNHREMA